MTSEALNHDGNRTGSTADLTCRSCAHFDDDPGRLEAEVPGILVFGSAYGSSRGHAGLCAKLDRFQDPIPADACPAFEELAPVKPPRSSGG